MSCAHALTKEPQEPWLFGRFGVRFMFVVVVACLARARALTKEPQEPWLSVGLVFAFCLWFCRLFVVVVSCARPCSPTKEPEEP